MNHEIVEMWEIRNKNLNLMIPGAIILVLVEATFGIDNSAPHVPSMHASPILF